MFRCPNCGFEDLSVWKACKWRRYAVYCYTEELEPFRPDLVARLRKEGWIHDGYDYKMTKDGRIIYRMLEMGKAEFKTHGFTEKPKLVDPAQKKLGEACVAGDNKP